MWVKSKEFKKILGLSNQALYERRKKGQIKFKIVNKVYFYWLEENIETDANRYGKELVKINRFYPSSKTCNSCGWINQELKLSDRKWACKCGETHDRDINASINILKEGLKIYGKGLAITKVESKSDFSDKAHSMKPETH